jgi:hypothetical protein
MAALLLPGGMVGVGWGRVLLLGGEVLCVESAGRALFEGCAWGVRVESRIALGVRWTLRPPGMHVSQAGEGLPAGEVARRISRWAADVVRLEGDVGRFGKRVRPVRGSGSGSELSAV